MSRRSSKHEAPPSVTGRESSEHGAEPASMAIQFTDDTANRTTKGRRQRKPTKKGKPKRSHKGWGPYNSVLKERSVDFNLTLDVQNLKQEIQQLSTIRDLLQSRVLQLRHSPTGSLMQLVREFFRVFREGLRVEQPHASRRRRVITQSVQTDFLSSVLDQDELNSDLGRMGGVGFMIEQFRRYSLLLRMICLKMDSFDIVLLDDNVVMVKTKGSLRFQVLRETIMAIFPHVLGNEWLCSRLIGAEVTAPTVITFHFNTTDLICGYEPDIDHVTGFTEILRNPSDVLELLGRARIGMKATIGVTEDGRLENVDLLDEPEHEEVFLGHDEPSQQSLYEQSRFATRDGSPNEVEAMAQRRHTRKVSPAHNKPRTSLMPSQLAHSARPSSTYFQSAVGQYVLAFANGWWPEVDALSASAVSPPCPQQAFLRQCVSPHVIVGHDVGHKAIESIWKSLCSSFDFVSFRAMSPPQVYVDGEAVCARIRVSYELAIDISTLQNVFPHVLRHPVLVQALLDAEVSCPSDLQFEWLEGDTLVTRLNERLDWDAALLPLLPRGSDRAFVLAEALLSREGYVEVASTANI